MTPPQSANQQIKEALDSVTMPTSWQPDSVLLNKIMLIIANDVLSSTYSHRPHNREDSETYGLLMRAEPIKWFWNMTNDKRGCLDRLISAYHSKSNKYGGVMGYRGMDSVDQKVIVEIVQKVYDALPLSSFSIEVQRFRLNLLRVPINRAINFLQELNLAIIAGSHDLVGFWRTEGLRGSADPAFFAFAWSKIKRGEGYVDKRNEVILNAARCPSFPEIIIDDLASAGHSKNRIAVVTAIATRIMNLKRDFRALLGDVNSPYNKMICDYQATLARFAGSDDSMVLRTIIPFLKKDDLLFAAPTASKLGLTKIVEAAMKAIEL